MLLKWRMSAVSTSQFWKDNQDRAIKPPLVNLWQEVKMSGLINICLAPVFSDLNQEVREYMQVYLYPSVYLYLYSVH